MMIDKEHAVQRKNELQASIKLRRSDIDLLLDFAIGYKKLANPNLKLMRYQKNELRLISTIRQLHRQIRELEKEYKLLTKMLIKEKENNDANA